MFEMQMRRLFKTNDTHGDIRFTAGTRIADAKTQGEFVYENQYPLSSDSFNRYDSLLFFEPEFEEEDRRGQQQREQVCRDNGYVIDHYTIYQPQSNAKGKKQKHSQRQILC